MQGGKWNQEEEHPAVRADGALLIWVSWSKGYGDQNDIWKMSSIYVGK